MSKNIRRAVAHDDKDEEDNILASVQANAVDQSSYEEDVLRQATLATAPALCWNDGRSGGRFPGNDDGFEPNIILARISETRKQLSNDPDNDRSHLKVQLLLHWLADAPRAANHRNKNFAKKHSNKSLTKSKYQEPQEKQGTARMFEKLKRLEDERSKRLHEGTTTASRATAAAIHTNENQRDKLALTRKRVPMMKRKYASMMGNDDEDNENDTVRKKPAVKTAKNELQRRRAERQQQRAQRRQRYRNEQQVDQDSDVEFGDDADAADSKPAAKIVDLIDSASDDDNGDVDDGGVVCPSCQMKLPITSQDDRDEALARHLSVCNTEAVTARPRRTSRFLPSSYRSSQNSSSKPTVDVASIRQPTATTNPALDDWNALDYEDRVEDWIQHGLEKMPTMDQLRDTGAHLPGAQEYSGGLFVPAWINDRLFEYQRTGVQWMWELHQQYVGGIVGDEMGLGKTVQVAAFLGAATASRKLKSVLVVAPATMLQHWLLELATWAPGLRRILIHSSNNGGQEDRVSRHPEALTAGMLRRLSQWLKAVRADRVNEIIDDDDLEKLPPHSFCGTGFVIVTTYENLRRNCEVYTKHSWSYLVLDEAQKIRNPDAEVTIACKQIPTPHRLAMSGTPIQNDLRELWSLFDFVFPGRLGTLPTFEQEFADPIKRGGYTNASPMQVQLAYRCALMLRDLIEPFLMRRLKRDVKEMQKMPGKTEQVLFCRLSRLQRDMYEAYLQSDEIKHVMKGSGLLLKATVVLRKIANHPDLVCEPDQAMSFVQTRGSSCSARLERNEDDTEDYDDDDEDLLQDEESLVQRSGKLEVLSKILPLWHKQGHRVLIFCQWKKMLNIIQRFTMLNGWKFGRLDGNTNVGSRQRLVDTFNTDLSYMGLLCTTRTGGVGLNLTGANRIILYDPDWNPSSDAQARERAWRFGQEREVTIYRLITAGTIEEKIYHRQIFKTALSNKILQDPKQRRMFSQRDLKDLFTLSPDSGSVRSGGDGMTATLKLTKGHCIAKADNESGDDEEEHGTDDNDATLKKVMKSKGLAGIFDHHTVEASAQGKSASAQEMEEQAKRVAREAAKALQNSVPKDQPLNVPTWTGSDVTKPNPSRFGSSRAINTFDRTSSVSSSNLLSSIRKQNDSIQADGEEAISGQSKRQYVQLMKRIQQFVHERKPTTDEILDEFKDVSHSADVAIFRQLLKTVAKVNHGRWVTK